MKEDWNVSGLLLEGVSGSGKTELLRALLKSDSFRSSDYLSTVVLTEHQTQRVLELKDRTEGLTPDDNLGLLEQHVAYVESLNTRLQATEWCRKGQTRHRVRFVLERFHLTHVVQYAHMDWSVVASIDRRLAALDCTLCLLVANSETLEHRIFENRDEAWLAYIRRFGSAKEEIVAHFTRQQDALVALSEQSAIRSIHLDTGTTDTERVLAELLEKVPF